jgi:hypothetical protein
VLFSTTHSRNPDALVICAVLCDSRVVLCIPFRLRGALPICDLAGQGEGQAEILDIKTSSRQGPKPGDILGEMMVHVHRTLQAIEGARKHKFNL